jgi:alpha-L-arabinofuranosidase
VSGVLPKIGSRDHIISLRARKTGGSEGFLIGFGALDDESYYWWNLGGYGNTQHVVEKFSSGDKSAAAPGVSGKIDAERWYDIRIEVSGQRVRCLLDGHVVHDFVDQGFRPQSSLFASTVYDSRSKETILKIVNAGKQKQTLSVELQGVSAVDPQASITVLSGDPMSVNDLSAVQPVLPKTETINVDRSFQQEVLPHSLSVIRLKAKRNE